MKAKESVKITIILLVVFIGLIGWGAAWSHLRAFQSESAEKLSSVASDSHEATRIRVLLRDCDEKILEHADKLAGAEGHRARTRREIVDLRDDKSREKRILKRAKELLSDTTQTRLNINGREYSLRQVEDDAVARVSNVKALDEKIALAEQVGSRLDMAIRDGEANLSKAKKLRQEMAERLNLLEIRLKSARVIESVAAFTEGLSENPIGPQTDLGKAFRSFEKRVASLERRNDVVSSGSRGGTIVDYESTSTVSALQAIDEVLADETSGPGKIEVASELGRALEDSIVD